MSERSDNPILVAVGDDPADAALAYAAGEAAREGCGLHLLHVVHVVAQGPETMLVQAVDLEGIGRQVLDAALERIRDLVPEGTPVTTELAQGAVVPAIVHASKEGIRMVVLQHRELSRLRRVLTRSVTSGVAAHAHVPVVSVPSSWSPDRTTFGSVTVGVDVPDRAQEVLKAAAHAASTRGAELRALHTLFIPDVYLETYMGAGGGRPWLEEASALIRKEISDLGEVTADLPVRVDALQGQAAGALVEASRSTDLLVVGRHDPLIPVGSHIGPVARAVLNEAECPVLLADPHPMFRRRGQGAAKPDEG